MNVYSGSDIGTFRSENQDRAFTAVLDGNAVFAVVCDGMGGENAGSFASEKSIEIISERIVSGYRADMNESSIRSLLTGALRTANAVVFDISETDSDKYGMGTTCVAALRRGGKVYVANAGDSRAYIINGDITQITKDHTVVMQLYESGEITKEEMRFHPQRNYITRAVGVSDTINPDYFEADVSDGDIILLCSDGLSGVCTDKQILDAVHREKNAEKIPERLIALALECDSRDNITAAVIV